MGNHLWWDDRDKRWKFKSDKYDWCLADFLPLKVTDKMAQPFIAGYADKRESVDVEFSEDLRKALLEQGYDPDSRSRGSLLIADERERQKAKWSEDHDDDHTSGDLAVSAAILAVKGTDAFVVDDLERDGWGLAEKHEGDYVRQLTIAGALLAAEIDRELRRLAATT